MSSETATTVATHASSNPQLPAVNLEAVSRTYGKRVPVVAMDSVSLQIESGSFVAVMGRSGSGKSTLLHCAAGLDSPTEGSVQIAGTEISDLDETSRTRFRRDHIGFIFQSYNLIPSLTIEQNITLPLRLANATADEDWLDMIVERVGLGSHLHRKPAELSGGQQQRATIARALASKPEVIFADEPTGALDLATAEEILDLLRDMVTEYAQTVVMVTHDPIAASWAQSAVVMADGEIDRVLRSPDVASLSGILGGYR